MALSSNLFRRISAHSRPHMQVVEFLNSDVVRSLEEHHWSGEILLENGMAHVLPVASSAARALVESGGESSAVHERYTFPMLYAHRSRCVMSDRRHIASRWHSAAARCASRSARVAGADNARRGTLSIRCGCLKTGGNLADLTWWAGADDERLFVYVHRTSSARAPAELVLASELNIVHFTDTVEGLSTPSVGIVVVGCRQLPMYVEPV